MVISWSDRCLQRRDLREPARHGRFARAFSVRMLFVPLHAHFEVPHSPPQRAKRFRSPRRVAPRSLLAAASWPHVLRGSRGHAGRRRGSRRRRHRRHKETAWQHEWLQHQQQREAAPTRERFRVRVPIRPPRKRYYASDLRAGVDRPLANPLHSPALSRPPEGHMRATPRATRSAIELARLERSARPCTGTSMRSCAHLSC